MTFGQMVDIINALITAFNDRSGALDNCITDGKIDYNKLINRPKINNILLEGNLTQENLSISIDRATEEVIEQFSSRVGSCEDFDNSITPRIATLETERTTDREDIDELLPYRQRVATLEEHRTTDSGNISTLQTALAGKADAADVPTTQQWTTIQQNIDAKIITMEQKVVQAGNSAQTATSKALEATQAAQSVSGMETRLHAAELTIGDANSGLVKDVSGLKTDVGNANEGMKKTVSDLSEKINNAQTGMDHRLKEARSKINETIEAVKEGGGKIEDVAELVGDLLDK